MAGKLTGAGIAAFRRKLLAWYRGAKRDLPWRRTRDPYRIWLAEIMLQQTRVAAVVSHYEQFLDRFPTVEALAQSPVEDVLRLWSGLGYYSRARNLHRAAQEIVARHAGQFPCDPSAALALPGIGRYTAAAISSIAYGEPHAVLDGNVARVLARLDAIRGDLRAPGRWRGLEARAQEILAQRAPGDWNQAMMELGATIACRKRRDATRAPCGIGAAPLRWESPANCPPRVRKPKPVRVTLAAAVFVDPRRRTLLLHSNAREAALFSRLWQFPAVEADGDPHGAHRVVQSLEHEGESYTRGQTQHEGEREVAWNIGLDGRSRNAGDIHDAEVIGFEASRNAGFLHFLHQPLVELAIASRGRASGCCIGLRSR